MHQVIHIHCDAPPKPREGAACNGCGVCCASEPCPIGVLVSGRPHGSCAALQWNAAEARYRCGLVSEPSRYLPRGLGWASNWVGRFALRYISSGSGCDCDGDCETLGEGDTDAERDD